MIGPIEYQYDTALNAVASVTFAAPGVGFHWAVHEIVASYDGVVAAADVTITGLEATWAHEIEVPASARGLKGTAYHPRGALIGQDNTAVVVSIPAGGASVNGRLGAICRKVTTASL